MDWSCCLNILYLFNIYYEICYKVYFIIIIVYLIILIVLGIKKRFENELLLKEKVGSIIVSSL